MSGPGNRKTLVTGGARGLGRAVVETLAAAGHDVVFTYNASAGPAEELATRLGQAYPGQAFETLQADLKSTDDVARLCSELEAAGPFYGLVHNAGHTYDTLAAVMDQARAEEVMAVNYWSLTRLVPALVRPMTRAREGRIVVIGSVVALRGSVGNAAYAASKAALLGYVQTLAAETARRGVTVNYVAPGFIDTDMMAPYAERRETLQKQIPLGRFATPEDIAGVVGFLLSPQAGYITGATLPVDGGLSSGLPIQR
ncbi:SDR family oxidoreductase [Lutibaculum baratangense]|uniref:3-oxoacyl-[acyl-carrier protein] reductase n=1 Tax=Lutibaculum baratangense AMV1 TaxID=631454 RepID=V4QWW5_9HYPH|nr:SDR family oxidoreductase [Lutibaculum baratangense]ESR24262.1 3-oxoacyl-[acyl-carrier protein] reductase [Lutibaculum baratangense AMV1]